MVILDLPEQQIKASLSSLFPAAAAHAYILSGLGFRKKKHSQRLMSARIAVLGSLCTCMRCSSAVKI